MSEMQNYREKFITVPDKIRDYIASEELNNTVVALRQTHKLTIEQMGLLSEVILKTLFGDIKAEDFGEEITKRIPLPPENTTLLIKDVDEKIFKVVRTLLKDSYGDPANAKQTPLPGDVTPTVRKDASFVERGAGVLSVQTAEKEETQQVNQPPTPVFVPDQKTSPKPPLSTAIPKAPVFSPAKQSLADAIASLEQVPGREPRVEQNPVAKPSTSSAPIPQTSKNEGIPTLRTLPQDIAAIKLAGQVRNPMEVKNITPASDPNKPKVDPYREPLS